MTVKIMSLIARRELHASIRERYRKSNWIEKRKLLDGFVAATGYERKYAIQLLNKDEMPVLPKKRPGSQLYDEQVRQALISVWNAVNAGVKMYQLS